MDFIRRHQQKILPAVVLTLRAVSLKLFSMFKKKKKYKNKNLSMHHLEIQPLGDVGIAIELILTFNFFFQAKHIVILEDKI